MSVKNIDNVGRYLAGLDIPLWDCGLVLHPPKVKDIEAFGETDFLQGFQALIQYEDIIEDLKKGNPGLQNAENFPLLLEVLETDDGEELRKPIKLFLTLCFPSYDIVFDKNSINFIQEEVVKGRLAAYNFQSFLDVVSDLFSFHGLDGDENKDYNPADEKAKEIAEKLKKAKEKIRQQKGENTDDNGKSLYSELVSVLSVGLPCDMRSLFDYTPFQLLDSYNRFMAKMQYDYYERLSMVPLMDLKDVEQPKNWTLPLY